MSEDDKALVKRLRLGDFYRDDAAYWEVDAGKADALCDQAADRIEQLTAEVERLRGLLCDACDYIRGHIVGPVQRDGILREARAALEGKQ